MCSLARVAPGRSRTVSCTARSRIPSITAARCLKSSCSPARPMIHQLGGEVRFETRVEDIEIDDGKVRGLTLSNGETLRCDHVVLSVGHSARDTFEMLHDRGVYMEAKPFSLGFRIEHPQGLIDRSRFGKFA